MRRSGSSPEPARMPSLAAITAGFRLLEAARRFFPDEAQHVLDRSHAGKARRNAGDALGKGALVAFEERLIGVAQALDLFAREAAALHANDVEAGEPRAIAQDRAVGNDVALDAGDPADHRILADAHELMDGAEPAEDRVVADFHMAGKGRVVGHDHFVADLAV